VFEKIKEIGSLLFLFFWVKLLNLWESIKIVKHYYRYPSFILTYLIFILCYLFFNPYRVSRRYQRKVGRKHLYTYGETPLTSFAKIMSVAGVKSSDFVLELGSGRGLSCFWLSDVIGCQVIGVEEIPIFLKIARFISRILRKDRVVWKEEDILDTDLSKATVVYFYGTGFDGSFLDHFFPNLEKLSPGTCVVTVSYPISEYYEETTFYIESMLSIRFPWGWGDVYIQRK
jgi:hypothetical protein